MFLINTTKDQHISRYEKIKNIYDQIPNTLTGRDKYEWMKLNINADDFKPVMSLVKNNILYAKKIIHQQLRPTGNKYKDVDLPKRFSLSTISLGEDSKLQRHTERSEVSLTGESLRFFGEICNLFYYPNCKSLRMTQL